MRPAKARYEDLIFINCPFDPSYFPMLRAILFAIYRCGFAPISALSYDNGLENRLHKIEKCISSAKFGIHDLCKVGLSPTGLPRFNMPFELGLFFGAKEFGAQKQKKNAIIFDSKKFRYNKFISDLNGVDIKVHDNSPYKVIKYIRDWLSTTSGSKTFQVRN